MKKTILVFGIVSLMLLSLVTAGFNHIGRNDLKKASTTDMPFTRHAKIVPPANELCDRADIDKDGRVTPVDRAMMLLYFGKHDCSINNNWCNRRDITRDGKVNPVDFNRFKLAWGCNKF